MDTASLAVTAFVALIGSGSATAIVNWILTRTGRNNPVHVGIRLLLQDKIEYLGMKFIEKGEITYQQKKTLHAMHDCYHSGLHGNGDLDDLMKDVDELNVIYPSGRKKGEQTDA